MKDLGLNYWQQEKSTQKERTKDVFLFVLLM